MIEGETPYFIEHVFSELSPNPEISGIRASEFRMMPFTGRWETTMIEAETPYFIEDVFPELPPNPEISGTRAKRNSLDEEERIGPIGETKCCVFRAPSRQGYNLIYIYILLSNHKLGVRGVL